MRKTYDTTSTYLSALDSMLVEHYSFRYLYKAYSRSLRIAIKDKFTENTKYILFYMDQLNSITTDDYVPFYLISKLLGIVITEIEHSEQNTQKVSLFPLVKYLCKDESFRLTKFIDWYILNGVCPVRDEYLSYANDKVGKDLFKLLAAPIPLDTGMNYRDYLSHQVKELECGDDKLFPKEYTEYTDKLSFFIGYGDLDILIQRAKNIFSSSTFKYDDISSILRFRSDYTPDANKYITNFLFDINASINKSKLSKDEWLKVAHPNLIKLLTDTNDLINKLLDTEYKDIEYVLTYGNLPEEIKDGEKSKSN